jgi:hypothetical protein
MMMMMDIDFVLNRYNVMINFDHELFVKNYNINQLEVDHRRELVDRLMR